MGFVVGADAFEPLANFWREVLRDAKAVADKARKHHPLSKERFHELMRGYDDIDNTTEQASVYYALNRSSFSGLTLYGGLSKGHKARTESAIVRLEQFKCPNLTVEHGDFRETIQAHPTHFLFCDPPYVLKKDFIYGIRGDLHRDFPHGVLADLLKARDGWMLC